MKQAVLGDPYFLQTKQEIEDWLNKMRITDYCINANLFVDINNNINISLKGLTKIPIKFGKIKGDFNCSVNELTSLKGCPEFIDGDFDCSANELTSLKHCPKIIKGEFNCSNNKLTSLLGCPKSLNEIFNCSNNKLKTLKYFPIVEDIIFIKNNPIKTFKGLRNISTDLLHELLLYHSKLKWEEIEWDNVKNLDEIITELYRNIKIDIKPKESEEILRIIQELQLY